MANKIKKMMNNGTAYTVGGIESSNDTYENIIHLTQAEYDALETKDPDTLYSTPDNAESGEFSPENEGTEGQVLKKTSTGYSREDLAEGGEEGQVLMKTEDGYAWCDAPGGVKYGYIDLLVVGGGGASGGGSKAGGGGAGGFVECECLPINNNSDYFNVYVGRGGSSRYTNGGCSYFWEVTANGGGAGGCSMSNYCNGKGGASGGGGAGCCSSVTSYGGTGSQGGNGGNGNSGGGGGGGAGGDGCMQAATYKGGDGGIGKCSCISGECCWYAGGGAGGSDPLRGGTGCQAYGGCGGGGDGNCDATYYGGGGGGQNFLDSGAHDGLGYQGVVILRYKTNGSSGLLPTSSGGCKYTCGEYTIHCFTNAGNIEQFIPVFK